MKPIDERYQAATRVNAISPEIVVVEEADSFNDLEGSMDVFEYGKNINTLPGSQAVAWY